MSVYTGTTQGTSFGIPLDDRPGLSVNVDEAEVNTYNPSVYAVPSPSAGNRLYLSMAKALNVWDASLQGSVNAVFYQGIYFLKNTSIINSTGLGLGNVSSDVQTTFSFFSPKGFHRTVEDVGILSAEANITVDDLSVSDVIGPYEERTVTITALRDGPAQVSTFFYIRFEDDPTTYMLAVFFLRIANFYVMEPDWASGMNAEYRYLTSLFSAGNAHQTRKVLRSRPQRALSVSVPFYNRYDAGQAWAKLRDMAQYPSAHPWYPDRSVMTASSTATRVYCDVDNKRYFNGGYAFLIRDNGIEKFYELMRIFELQSDGFTTVDDIANSYVEGDIVYPAFVCLAQPDGITQPLYTDNKAVIEIELEEVYEAETLALENSGYTPTTSLSMPLFPLTVNFEGIEVGVYSEGEVKSSGRGFSQTRKGTPYAEQEAQAICETRALEWEAVGFFNYVRGRGRPFWAKSEIDWMEIESTATNLSFIVSNPLLLADFEYLKYVWIEDSTGTVEVVGVASVEAVGDTFRVNLDSNTLADIASVRQAHAVTLAEDVIRQEYVTDSVSVFYFRVREVQGI